MYLGGGSRRWARTAEVNTKNKLRKLSDQANQGCQAFMSGEDFEPQNKDKSNWQKVEIETRDWNPRTFSNSTSKSAYERMGPDIHQQFSTFSYATDM